MRKKTINHLADTIFWYLLYFFPIVGYLLFLIAEPSSSTTVLSLGDFFSRVGLSFFVDNPILDCLSQIFVTDGILPLFSDATPLLIFVWFCSIFLVHLFVDVILFLPRQCHKWLRMYDDDI